MAKSTIVSEVLKSCKRELWAGMVFSFFINVLMLAMPLYMISVFSRVLMSRSYTTLVGLFAVTMLALAIMGVLMLLRDRMMERVAAKIDIQFSDIVLVNTLKNGLVNNAPRNGQILRDLQTLRRFIGGPQMTFIFDAPWIPVFLIFLLILNPPMGLFALFSAVLLGGISWWSERALAEPQREADQAGRDAIANAETMLRNAEVVEAMGMRARLLSRWRRQSGVALVVSEKADTRAAYFFNFSRTYRIMMQVLMITIGVVEVMNGMINPAVMFVGAIMMGRLLMPMEGLISLAKNFGTIRATLERVEEAIRVFPPPGGAMELPAPTGALAVQQAGYQPPRSKKPILMNINFALQPGESLGLVGPSGSGKTTLGKLVVGALTPGAGYVRLDGADVSRWDSDALGPYVGYLPQDVELFDGTVRENIARLDEEAAPEGIIAAAKLAGIHEFILHLPDGYDTVIGTGGHMLSGGQRQRVGLARALYGKPCLVVLDEPNSNLDIAGEQALAAALASLKEQGTTTILITHRPSVLSSVDKILVLKDGMVEMFGGREPVMQRILPNQAKQQPAARLAASSS